MRDKWGSTVVEFAKANRYRDEKKEKVLDQLTKLTSLKLYGITSIYQFKLLLRVA
jgi:hypothetical protein